MTKNDFEKSLAAFLTSISFTLFSPFIIPDRVAQH